MLKIGYRRCDYDCCVYVRSLDDGSFIFLLLYVDDMLIAANHWSDVNDLKTKLSTEFEMKDLGAARKILGMETRRDRSAKKLWLSQKSYVEDVLKRFDMSRSKPVSTPLANHFKLSLEHCPKQWRIQDPGAGGSKVSNEHIDKNIIKNNFNLFVLINYTNHSCLLLNFIFRVHILKSLNYKFRVNVIKYITLT